MSWTRSSIARVLADRKGVTAVEYGVIAVGGATVVIATYNAFFYRMRDYLTVISFGV